VSTTQKSIDSESYFLCEFSFFILLHVPFTQPYVFEEPSYVN